VESGVPVMGHLGLTPQSIHGLGGFRVQAKQKQQADRLLEDAVELERRGCFALVLECIPADLAARVTNELTIPTIGIGAGPATDGQVLVLQDMLGFNEGFQPKFLRKYLNGAELVKSALNQYSRDVREGDFPSNGESYSS
jgi:3-methyl-2-oxobutanoate hydroxymethyltransferase